MSISLRSTVGLAALMASMRAATASARTTSLAPFARRILKPTTGCTVESRKGAGLRNRIGDDSQIVQPHLAARRQRDPRRREIGNRLGAGEGADGLVASADLGAPAGEIHVTPAKLAADIERRQADRLEPNRIEPDPDFALDASDAIDPRDPANSLQRPYDHVVHEPGELLRRFSGCYRGVGEDRKPGNVDPLDHRLVDAAREIGADARHRVLDVIERAIRVRLQPERDRRAGYPIGDDGVDVVGAGDPGDGVLDRLRDPRFELRGCSPELRDGDRDDGNVDIRHARDRQLGEADVAEATIAAAMTRGGSGCRIDHAEILIAISTTRDSSHGPARRLRFDGHLVIPITIVSVNGGIRSETLPRNLTGP